MSGVVVFLGSFLVCVTVLGLALISRQEVEHLRNYLMASEGAAGGAAAAAPKPPPKPKAKRRMTPEEAVAAEIQAEAEAAEEPAAAAEPEEQTAEAAEEEAAPVDESAEGFRQSKVVVMKFLEQALSGMMKEGFKLDALSKFACHLFLAGASERLGRANKLSDKEFGKILETSVAVLGSGPDIAKRFGEKYEEYLLEPGYARMFRAGGTTMEDFIAGKGDLGDSLTKAVEQFKNPDEAKKGAGPVAVLFTDIVGSTKLSQQLGDAGAQKLVHLRNVGQQAPGWLPLER